MTHKDDTSVPHSAVLGHPRAGGHLLGSKGSRVECPEVCAHSFWEKRCMHRMCFCASSKDVLRVLSSFAPPPFCVHPLPLDMLQLFVNKGPLSHIPATGGSFTLTAVGWLSICVCSGRHSCFDVRGFGVLFKWEESSLDISLLHCG